MFGCFCNGRVISLALFVLDNAHVVGVAGCKNHDWDVEEEYPIDFERTV